MIGAFALVLCWVIFVIRGRNAADLFFSENLLGLVAILYVRINI